MDPSHYDRKATRARRERVSPGEVSVILLEHGRNPALPHKAGSEVYRKEEKGG